MLPCQTNISEPPTCESNSRRKTVAKDTTTVKAPQTKVTKVEAGGFKRRKRGITKQIEDTNEYVENDPTVLKVQPGKNKGKRAGRPIKAPEARRVPLEELDNGVDPSIGLGNKQLLEEEAKHATIGENPKPKGRKRKAGVEKVEEPAKRPRTMSSSEELTNDGNNAHHQSLKEIQVTPENVPYPISPSSERKPRPTRRKKTRGTEGKQNGDEGTCEAAFVKASHSDTGSEEENEDLGSVALSKPKGRRRKAHADEDPNPRYKGRVMQKSNRPTKGRPKRTISSSEEQPLQPIPENDDIPPDTKKSPVPPEKPPRRGRPKAKKMIPEEEKEESTSRSPSDHNPPPPIQEENTHTSTTTVTTEQPSKQRRGRRPKADLKTDHDDPPDANPPARTSPSSVHRHTDPVPTNPLSTPDPDPAQSPPPPLAQALHPPIPTTTSPSKSTSLRTHLSQIIKSQTGLPARLTALQTEAHRLRNSGKTPKEMGFGESGEEMEGLVRRMEGVVRRGGEILRGREGGKGGGGRGRERRMSE